MSWSLGKTAATLLAISMAASGCSYKFLFWERNVWQDVQGIFAMVEPADTALYRELLPEQFAVPEQPMVGLYVANFADTEPWPITPTRFLFPYLEATVLLRCDYQGRAGWHSLVMPVSTEASMIGGRRIGFPKYVADEIFLKPTEDGWHGAAVHEGEDRISLRFSRTSPSELGGLAPLQDEFMKGRGDAELRGPIMLLMPPGEGPKVNVLPSSPPPLVARETGTVRISLSEPYDGLVPDGMVAPGLYQRFTLPGGGGPSWTLIGLLLVFVVGISWLLVRKLRLRRIARAAVR